MTFTKEESAAGKPESHNRTMNSVAKLTALVRNLSPRQEFCLVLSLCFGFNIAYEFWLIAHHRAAVFSDRSFLLSTGMQVVLLAIALWIGKIRGWSLTTFGRRVSWKLTAGGVLLFVVVTAVQIAVSLLANKIHPETPKFVVTRLTVPVIFVLSVINPVFEEVLESGYIIYALQRYGRGAAVLASAAFRAFLHSYQGWNGVLNLFAFGLVFGFAYWKCRQLWPLVVAHFLADFLGLLYVIHLGG